MEKHRVGVIMNGVTGRMGSRQHLERSLAALCGEGGLAAGDGMRLVPDLLLVGRNPDKLKPLAEKHGGLRWTTQLDEALADPEFTVYFDAQTTSRRFAAVSAAIAAGKHIYCEKPTAVSSEEALELHRRAQKAGVKSGVVQDKLWLPGLLKLRRLIATGFFGKLLAVRGEFGYWVFDGEHDPLQRPSWNYRQAEGGGIIVDMHCHWRYVIDHLFGRVTSLTCLGANHLQQRWDEAGKPYAADADDASYSTLLTERGVICHFNSSWCTRVNREDLLVMQVDGTRGSAAVGLRDVWIQSDATTPRAVWDPDAETPIDYRSGWQRVPEKAPVINAFRAQWELFLRHVVLDEPFPWTLLEGAKGVQLAECALQSWQQRAWVDVPELA